MKVETATLDLNKCSISEMQRKESNMGMGIL